MTSLKPHQIKLAGPIVRALPWRWLRWAMIIGAGIVLALAPVSARAELATHSFTNHAGGTHPQTLALVGESLTVDLTAIAGVTVYRATLDPGRTVDYIDVSANALAVTTMRLSAGGDDPGLRAPRYARFDATAQVQAALAAGESLELIVEDPGIGFGSRVSLDVLCNLALPEPIAPVTAVAARFADGDAMITFTEPDPPIQADSVACADFFEIMQALDDEQKVRFRVYRASQPLITQTAVAQAEFVDEIKPLSGWNPRFLGPGGGCYSSYGSGTVHTLPVEDGILADGSTGIYVERFRGEGADLAYYLVSRVIDGAEDFSVLEEGLNASGAITRTAGPGMVLLNKIEYRSEFNYGASAGQFYYVAWAAPPEANFPSTAFNYVVAVPSSEFAVSEPGIDLGLHCWGGNLDEGYGWWYYFEQGHLLVAGNQFPFQDWWTGYHDNLGTLKGTDTGGVKPFTPYRLLDFVLDFVAETYHADPRRLVLSGSSMGGAGASLVGLRNGQVFSNLISWVGIHVPRESPTFAASFENAWGSRERNAPFSNEAFAQRFGGQIVRPEDEYGVWDYYDNVQWLSASPGTETPWLTFSNGTNDDGIGWPQAVAQAQALIDTGRPFNFQWGMSGHSQRVALLDPYGYDKTQKSHLVFSLDQSVPILSHGSADGDFNTDPEGKANAFCSWRTDDIIDSSDRWEISLFVPDAPSGGSYGVVFPDSVTTDVMPARLQAFTPLPDTTYSWSWQDPSGEPIFAAGQTTADSLGRLRVPQITILKDQPRRLIVTALSDSAVAAIGEGGGADRDGENHGGFAGDLTLRVSSPPGSGSTKIRYTLPHGSAVEVSVHDVAGRRLRRLFDGEQAAGIHELRWSGRDEQGRLVPAGLYLIRIEAGGVRRVGKAARLR